MLGIFLLYFIWNYYAELAFEYNKSRWGYGLLGIATYYIGTAIGGVAIGIYDVYAGTTYIEESSIIVSLIALPFGIATVWVLYKILQNRWKTPELLKGDSLDADLLKSDSEN